MKYGQQKRTFLYSGSRSDSGSSDDVVYTGSAAINTSYTILHSSIRLPPLAMKSVRYGIVHVQNYLPYLVRGDLKTMGCWE